MDVYSLGKIAVEAEGTAILERKVLKMYCTQNSQDMMHKPMYHFIYKSILLAK